MEADVSYTPERLDHLSIVAGICRQIELAELLNRYTEPSRQRVSVGMATVAMVLNGLGCSNRRLYLVPQFFENKPVERLLGEGVKACELNDDCLGRTLDWLYDHDVTRLFAGIARRAREVFVDVGKRRVHVDTTSFSVSEERGEKTLRRKMEKERKRWESVLRALAGREFACETDARGALSRSRLLPAYFLEVQEATFKAQVRYAGRGGRRMSRSRWPRIGGSRGRSRWWSSRLSGSDVDGHATSSWARAYSIPRSFPTRG